MKRKSLNQGMAIAFGAAGWVAIGVAAGAAIALAGRSNSAATCGTSDDKLGPPTNTE